MKEHQTPLNLSTAKPNILLIEDFQASKKYPKVKYCLIYLFVLLSFYFPFLLNYILTSKAFKASHYLYIPSDYLCNTTVKALTQCIEANATNQVIQRNNEVERCYNKAVDFNKKCFMYLSEMCLCRAEKRKCSWIFNDLRDCASRFNLTNIDDIIQYCEHK